ncbi:MAG: RNA 2',3'-cyclic phosphodiesterase [Verrucomicrobia bacterium]|nr:RNA 2',3'-cyclic phosphodiesterase [Verrucomicrobiota bacterium]
MAIHPDAATRAWIAAAQGRFRKKLGRFERSLRWVPAESSHVTLAFLGELPDAAPIAQVLEACRCVPMDLVVSGLGAFPNPRRPAVLWAGITDPSGNLARLQSQIADAVTPWVKPERRRFQPHLTLARVKEAMHFGSALKPLLTQREGEPQAWHVDCFALMQSQVDSAGAKHSVIHTLRPH